MRLGSAYSWFKLGGFMLALLLLWPVFQMIYSIVSTEEAIVQKINWAYLVTLSLNTMEVMIGTVILSVVIGVFFAWYMKLYVLRGKRILHYLLLIPLAMPSYVGAFLFLGLWDYSGSVQQWFREIGWLSSGFDIRTGSWGVVIALTSALFPYVYLLTSAALDRQSDSLIKSARLYGHQKPLAMVGLILKLIRPGVVAGAILVAMEVLADFGVVSMFNYDTFTLAIYSTWVDYRNTTLAILLSFNLVVFALVLVMVDQWSKGRRQYSNQQLAQPVCTKLNKWRLALFYGISILWIGFSLIAPLIQLIAWSYQIFQWDERYWEWLSNSVSLTLIGVVVIGMTGFIFSYLMHRFKGSYLAIMLKVFGIGYALPGTMLGIIMLIFWQYWNVPWVTGVLLVIWAYVLRFLPLSIKAMNAAWENISPSLEKAASLYSINRWKRFWMFYLPALKTGVVSGAVLVMLDLFKELPVTLMLRSTDWDTLPVRIFNLASEGLYEEASPAALMIVVVTCLLYSAARRLKR